MFKKSVFLLFTLLFLFSLVMAQSNRIAGKIQGAVFDKVTAKPLIGANVVLVGIQLGTATDMKGEYRIANVPAGIYDIKVTYIGYSPTILRAVTVVAGQTTNLKFQLEVQDVEGEIVEVIAEAREKIVSVRNTQMQETIDSEEISRMPVSDFSDVLANASGAVETEGGASRGIHIRGGRTGEVAYYVDGINTTDPVTKGKGIEIDNNAISQLNIITSAFSAEYGEAMSGAVSIITKEGADHYSGSFEYETDMMFPNFLENTEMGSNPWAYSYGINKFSGSLGGPLPFTNNIVSFFLSGTFQDMENRRAFFRSDDQKIFGNVGYANSTRMPTGTAKFVINPSKSAFKAIVSASYHDEQYGGYNHARSASKEWAKLGNDIHRGHNRISLKLQNNLSTNTAWELQVSRYNTFTKYSPLNGAHYTDFRNIMRYQSWTSDAIEKGWYDPVHKSWDGMINPENNEYMPYTLSSTGDTSWIDWGNAIAFPDDHNFMFNDGNNIFDEGLYNKSSDIYQQLNDLGGQKISDLDPEWQAFFYYYLQEGSYKLDNETGAGFWTSNSAKLDAFNQRWYDTGSFFVPALYDSSNHYWHDSSDSSVYYLPFNAGRYNDFLSTPLLRRDLSVERNSRLSDLNGRFVNGNISQNDFDMEMAEIESWYETESSGIDDIELENNLYDYKGDLRWYTFDRDIWGLYTYGFSPRYNDQNSVKITTEFQCNSQITTYHALKFGFRYTTTDLNYEDIQFSNPKPYFDSYQHKPMRFSGYLEDTFEYEDLIAYLGVRYELFKADANRIIDQYDLDSGTEETPVKKTIIPRFGVCFAMSDKTAMFANYGHFYQVAQYSEMYQNLSADITSGYPLIGNPDLEPEKVVAYEAGIRHTFSKDIGLEVTAYYKDYENLLATRSVNTMLDNNVARYTVQVMDDFAKAKGVDIRFNFRNFYGLYGKLTYSYLDAKGTGSSNREYYYAGGYNTDLPLPTHEFPTEYDITHQIRANVNYYLPPMGPKVYGSSLLGDMNINVQYNFNTGRPYTPEDDKGRQGELGSKRLPSTSYLDLRFDKFIRVGNLRLSLYADIRNLFYAKNIIDVYQKTGRPDIPDFNSVPRWNDDTESSVYYTYWYFSQPENGAVFENPETGEAFENPHQAYEVHSRAWKSFNENPYNYGRPRIARIGIELYF